MMTLLPTEKVNFLTHAFGFLTMIPAIFFLWPRVDSSVAVTLIYGFSALFMFGSSAVYHKYKKAENQHTFFRQMDHFAIFIMIAGSYTPIVWIWFEEPAKFIFLGVQWGITILGLFMTLFWKHRPRWVDPVLYLAMGWTALSVIPWLWALMSPQAFWLMMTEGLFYSVGGVIYALRRPVLIPGVFGFHELFHVFILAGAGAHYALVWVSLGG